MSRSSLVRALGVLFALMAPFQFAVAQRVPAAIPEGTQVQVRLVDGISSETAREGDTFRGTLQRAIVVNGRTEYPRGADVVGKVLGVHRSGRLSDPGELVLALTAIRANGAWYPVDVQPFALKGQSHAKNNVTKIGGGTAAGAIIGAMAGGGKGAAIGAGVGAGAGTVTAAATGRRDVRLESEMLVTWVALAPAAPRVAAREEFRGDGRRDRDEDDDRDHRWVRPRRQDDDDEGGYSVFSARDRQVIRTCMVDDRSNLPPGLAKKDHLPPGLERQLQRNGSLPPGLQKRVQPLPMACAARLPRLPADWSRVVLSGRVILLDPTRRILDMFELEGD